MKVEKAWRTQDDHKSLSEVHSSIQVPGPGASFWKKMLAFAGPGLMVSVGYMDPGNWATDLAGGARFGYILLSVILISNIFAMILQHLSLKLGIVAEKDLAHACRNHFHPTTNFILWILAEIAITACDLAEVIGSAIAINLLFGIPLAAGVCITALNVLVILYFQHKGFRYIESLVAGLIFIIFGCFAYELVVSAPPIGKMLGGLIPTTEIIRNKEMLYIAIGILGATVMPHNLYLHSAIIQTRNYNRTTEGKREAIKFATIDSSVSLFLAFFVNAAILIVSAVAFHGTEYQNITDIHDAYNLLTPVLGATFASTFFAIALLASGQNATLTGTLSGQIVMEGFIRIKLKPWMRAMITRLIAIVPALIVSLLYGEKGVGELLILSQVVLSLQLSFAVVPLVLFTSDKAKMGIFVNPAWLKITAVVIAVIIIFLNGWLLFQTLTG